MDELFADQSEEDEEGSPSHSPRSEDIEVTKATYREQLRDVLGSETTGGDDEGDNLDHPSSLGDAFSDDEHPALPTSDPQRPVSLTTPFDIHTKTLNTLLTVGNPGRTCRSCVIRSTILGTIHHILTRPVCLPPSWSPEYESPIPPPDDIPTAFFPHTSTLTADLHHYLSFAAIQRTLTRIITLLCALK